MYPTEVVETLMKPIPKATQPRKLRWYQDEAVAAVHEDWSAGIRRVGVVLPTGAGKSTVGGKVGGHAYYEGMRVLFIAHRAELLDQMRDNLFAVYPEIPRAHTGLVRAEHDDHHAPIVFATFQTLANAKRRQALGKRDVIIVDETHHIVATGYHATFEDLDGYADDCYMMGLTATMYRADNSKGKQAEIGLGDVIEKISYEKDLKWAIENEILVPPTGLTVRIEALNALNKIKNVAGDFNQKDLAEVMEAAVEYTVDAVEMHASDRQSIIFAASVEACKLITDQLNERGKIKAGLAIGLMGYDERQPVYKDFREGKLNAMVTVAVLSEGADFPMCDCVVMARPTRSRIMYSQMVGRALRLYTDPKTGVEKTDALVLDLSGSVRNMKLIHLSELVHGLGIDIKEVDEDGEEIEVPVCGTTGIEINVCECEDCVEARSPKGRAKGPQRKGVVDMVSIDLLNQSDTLWLETPAGIPFIPIEDKRDAGWNVVLFPENGDRTTGRFAVATMNTRNGAGQFVDPLLDNHGNPVLDEDGERQGTYYPQATAIRRAEETVVAFGKKLPSRFAPWRKRNQPPSDIQADFAKRLGIPEYHQMTRGRVSDEISIQLVANRVDWWMDGEQ